MHNIPKRWWLTDIMIPVAKDLYYFSYVYRTKISTIIGHWFLFKEMNTYNDRIFLCDHRCRVRNETVYASKGCFPSQYLSRKRIQRRLSKNFLRSSGPPEQQRAQLLCHLSLGPGQLVLLFPSIGSFDDWGVYLISMPVTRSSPCDLTS